MDGAGAKVTEGVAGAEVPPPAVVDEVVRPVEGEQKAVVETDQVVLRLRDFIRRIPSNLLKSGELDLDRTLRFDLGDLSDCIAEGLTAVPLALLVDAIPDIFIDDLRDQRLTEIRFPWTRILEILKDPPAARDGNDGQGLLQSLQRRCICEKPSSQPPAHAPSEARLSGRRESGRTNVWFSRKNGSRGNGATGWKRELAHEGASAPSPGGAMGSEAKQTKEEAPVSPSLDGLNPPTDPSEGALVKVPATTEPAARCKVSPIAQAVRIADLEKQLKELSARYLGEIATLRAEVSRRSSPVREEDESELAQVCKELAELQGEYQWVLEESARAREEAVARVAAERDGQIKEKEMVIRELDARLADMAIQHEAAMELLRDEFEGKLRDGTSGPVASESQIADLKREHQRALEESARGREEAVAQAVAERDGLIREKETAAKDHEALLAGISTELESLRAASDARREDADRLLELLQREYLDASALAQRELELLQVEHRKAIEELTALRTQLAQHRETVEEQAARLQKADGERAEAIARLEAEHEWDIGQIVQEMQKNLSALHPAIPEGV